METQSEKRGAHHRSPSYPVFSLGAAIEKTKAVYDNDKRSATTADVIASHLGYSAAKGPGGRAVSALKQFGLLEENSGKYRISDLGFTLVHFDRDSNEWRHAAMEAAIHPTLFRELYDEHPNGLPSDAALRSDLLKRGFNPSAIPEVISIARDTMSLANAGESIHNEGVEDTIQIQDSTQVRIEDARPKPFGTPKIVKEILTQRVSPDCMVQVVFDGPVSQRAVEKLIAYLDLAKDNYPEKTPFVLGDLKTYGSAE